jgi:hypothetical protein
MIKTMKNLLIICTLFLAAACAGFKSSDDVSWGGGKKNSDTEKSLLRFDGLYYRDGVLVPGADANRAYTYFRFYPDGTVVRLSSASKPEQVAKFITKDNQIKDGKGKYHLKNNQIDFSMKTGNNYVTHEGDVLQDSIRLTIYGVQNSATYQELYTFMKLDLEK